MPNSNYTTFKETYTIGKEIAGDYQGQYQRSLVLYALAFVCQGLAYLSLFQLFNALLSSPIHSELAWYWLAAFVLCLGINGLARWFAHDFDYTATLPNVMHQMRLKLGDKLRTMPLERLNRYKTGDLNASLSSSVEESVTMLGMVSGMFLEVVITPLVVIIGLFFIDWRIALVLLVMMLLIVPLYIVKRRMTVLEKSGLGQAHAELESDIIEYVQGLPVLRATNQTGLNAKRLQHGILHVHAVQRATFWPTLFLLLLSDMLILAALVVIAMLGSLWVNDASLTIAAVAAILIMVSRLMEPMSLFLAVTVVLDIMSSSFRRVKELLDIPPLATHQPVATAQQFDIQLEGVDFRYQDQDQDQGQHQHAIRNVTVSMPTNAMTAIVGPSGSGKTTLTKLLMRYADPQHGSIKIGGIDIRNMSQQTLLSHFAVVFQEVYLFDASIFENIRLAKPSASDNEVIAAAKSAYCHEFINRLPAGYHTRVGDIGGSLSGGERQRISIARAILKDAPIVILDEPTAALDTESELAVQKAIDALVQNKTLIVIAHRLSTIAGADQILVIEQGELLEQGTHQTLLKHAGRYHDLWQAQLRSKVWKCET